MVVPRLPMVGRDLSRRGFLRNLFVGSGLLSLPDILRLQAEASLASTPTTGKKRSLILLWQDGGPSHFETFDPKPEAPDGVRGELGAIPTSLPGVKFCEVLPRLSKIAHRFSIIRSLHQPSSGHVDGSHNVLTGYDGATVGSKSRYPDLAAIIHRMRSGVEDSSIGVATGIDPRLIQGISEESQASQNGSQPGKLPHYISVGNGIHRGGPSYLGSAFGPFKIAGDPAKPFFKMRDLQKAVTRQRFLQRWSVYRQLNQYSSLDAALHELDARGEMEAMDGFQQQAFDLLTGSGAAARAFDLTREPTAMRERYGLHTSGQQALLARRLVEAGVSVVAVRFCPDGRGDYEKSGIGWDDHAVHGNIFQVMRKRGPKFDQSVSALVDDLEERGMSDDVMVVLLGEFGRTPNVYNYQGCPGREHWGRAGNALVYGGGMNMGQVIGSTNDKGQEPKERPLKTQSLLATIYQQMGINIHHTLNDADGRPIPILRDAEPISELVG